MGGQVHRGTKITKKRQLPPAFTQRSRREIEKREREREKEKEQVRKREKAV